MAENRTPPIPIARLRDEYVEMRTKYYGFADLYADEFDRSLAAHDAELRAEVERLRERMPCDGGCDYNSGPEETCSLHGRAPRDIWDAVSRIGAEREEMRAHAERAEQQVADLRAGIEALATEGEAWGRGVAVELSKRLRDLLAESAEQPGERPECGDATCWFNTGRPAPVVPDSADVRERAIEAGVKAVKASPHGRWLVMPGPVSIQRQVATLIADAVLAVVGQGVTAEQRDEAILAATREVAKQARPWPGDGLLHDVRPVEAADAAVRAALESLGVAVRPSGQEQADG